MEEMEGGEVGKKHILKPPVVLKKITSFFWED